MRSAILHVSIGLAMIASAAACNQILGIKQGRLPDGGVSTSSGAGGAGSGSDAGPTCNFSIEGDYAESETVLDDTCGTGKGSTSKLGFTVTGGAAVVTVNGTELTGCPAPLHGCALHLECTLATTGGTLTADLTFNAPGFSGTLESATANCSTRYRSTGVRQ